MKEKQIDREKLMERIGFVPHDGQRQILDCKERDKTICCGRRWGKTTVAAFEATEELLYPNRRVWIVAPDYSLTQIVFNQVMTNISKITDKFSMSKKPTPILRMPNGSVLECKSGENPKGMLGWATDLNILDEAARLSEEIWFQYVKPTTHDRGGRTIKISTPRGMNWFYDDWLNAGKGQFHFMSNNSPYFNEKEWDSARAVTPERIFEQEYMAKFVSGAGSVFRNLDDIIEGGFQEPQPGHSYIMGVDLAKHNDFSVLMVLDRISKSVVYIDRFTSTDYNLQKKRIISLAKKYNNAKVIIDSSGLGDPIVEDIRREMYVLSYSMHSNKAKQQLIEKLSIFIEQKLIKIPEDEILIKELRQYEYDITQSGYTRYSAPKGRNDDTVIALALAVWLLTPNNEEKDDSRRVFKQFNEYL